ncbi:MAG: hypothetical protein ABIK93_10310 [candidate division WOR-3 bacterium]
MKKEIVKQIYAYTICAIALGCGMIFLCVGIYGIVKIAAPEFTIPQWEWKKVATFQSFKTDWETTEGTPKLTDEELKIRWQDKREIAIMSEKREGGQNITYMLICFIIVIPIFVIHWRLAKKLREE